MRRQERVGLHKKQERPSIQNGIPSVSELIEGVPAFRNTPEGLVQYVRYSNRMYKNVLQDTSGEKFVIPDRDVSKSSGILFQQNGGSEGAYSSGSLAVTFSILSSNKYSATFIAPSSGNVLIEGQCYIDFGASPDRVYFSWAGITPPSTTRACLRWRNDEVDEPTVNPKQVITGLIPGHTYVYYLWVRRSTETDIIIRWGGAYCQRIVIVTALP